MSSPQGKGKDAWQQLRQTNALLSKRARRFAEDDADAMFGWQLAAVEFTTPPSERDARRTALLTARSAYLANRIKTRLALVDVERAQAATELTASQKRGRNLSRRSSSERLSSSTPPPSTRVPNIGTHALPALPSP